MSRSISGYGRNVHFLGVILVAKRGFESFHMLLVPADATCDEMMFGSPQPLTLPPLQHFVFPPYL